MTVLTTAIIAQLNVQDLISCMMILLFCTANVLAHIYYNREPALQMKAVTRNLAHNPYGAPTVFMTGGWMNLKRVCHVEKSRAAALKSPQGQLGLAVI